jgi:hypothetical protein
MNEREYDAAALLRDATLVANAIKGLDDHKKLAVLGYVTDAVLEELDPCTRAKFVKKLGRVL